MMSSSKEATSRKKEETITAYTAFNAVDEMVQKPVMGSDGAARWQNFRSTAAKQSVKVPSVAPTAPLKAVDRTIFKSWQEERKYEEEERQKSGATALGSGYTHFAKKGTEDDERLSKKERQRIQQRRRPDDKEYYIPSKSFTGWKFDYVFTTRDSRTGYYWDGMDSLKSLETTGQAPKIIILEESGEQTAPESTEKKKEKEEKALKPKKRKRPRGPEFVDDPTNPFQQLAERFHAQQQQRQSVVNEPSGWEAAYDTFSQKTYYYNRSTGERSWELPTSLNPSTPPVPTTTTQQQNDSTAESLPPGWIVAKDSSTGKEYYYHSLTQKTQWERPME
jgi:hypothetical protein